MNRESINTATVNADVIDVIQRAVVSMVAVASAVLGGLVLRRSPVGSSPMGNVSLIPRALRRDVKNRAASAAIVLSGMFRVWGHVSTSARASINVAGLVFPRRSVYSQVSPIAQARVWATGRLLSKASIHSNAIASVNALYSSYTQVRGLITSNAYANATISFETRKQIPYDEDAPFERVMRVDEDIRTVVVS